MFKSFSKTAKAVYGAIAVMVLVLVGGSIAGNVYLSAQLAHSEHQNDTLVSQNQSAANANQRLLRQYTNVFNQYKSMVGKNPVGSTPSQAAADSKVKAVAGPQGPAGADATTGQVQSAVDAYCAILNRCVGPPGKNGANGANGTSGKDGKNGLPGTDGKAGSVGAQGDTGSAGANGKDGAPGATGPKGDAGPAGPAGADGAAGSDGRGINNMSCDGSHFVVTYTDGTTQMTNATCTTDVVPQS